MLRNVGRNEGEVIGLIKRSVCKSSFTKTILSDSFIGSRKVINEQITFNNKFVYPWIVASVITRVGQQNSLIVKELAVELFPFIKGVDSYVDIVQGLKDENTSYPLTDSRKAFIPESVVEELDKNGANYKMVQNELTSVVNNYLILVKDVENENEG